MKSKLNYLINISLKRKIKTKWFLIANIVLGALVVGLINVDSVINFFGGDFNEKQQIYIIDNTDMAHDIFKEQLTISSKALTGDKEESSYIIKEYTKGIDEAKKLLEKEPKALIIKFDNSEQNIIDVELISKEYIDIIDSQILNGSINNTKVALAIYKSNISIEEITKIYEPVKIQRTFLDENKNSNDENMEIIMTTVFPIIILPLFMLIIFLVQMIGAEVNDEKTTRGMEIIISNVSPKTHFFSKIIAGNLFVLLQGGLLLSFSALGLFIRKFIGGNNIIGGLGSEVTKTISNLLDSGFGEKLIYILPLTLILMILTFIAYSLLAGILASMTTNIEDFQQVQTPIVIVLLLGYYLATMAGLFKGAIFIKVLSFVPLISAILSPSLLVLGQIGITEVLIAIVLMALTNWILIKYGLKIYKVGILNYSSSGMWKKMFKALKN